jgi:hypothetical protein
MVSAVIAAGTFMLKAEVGELKVMILREIKQADSENAARFVTRSEFEMAVRGLERAEEDRKR